MLRIQNKCRFFAYELSGLKKKVNDELCSEANLNENIVNDVCYYSNNGTFCLI